MIIIIIIINYLIYAIQCMEIIFYQSVISVIDLWHNFLLRAVDTSYVDDPKSEAVECEQNRKHNLKSTY